MVARSTQHEGAGAPHLQALPTASDLKAFWDEVETQLDGLAERLILEIRNEIPSYHALPASEQVRTVRELLGAMTESLKHSEPPQPARLQMIRASARRRAYYGMPVYDVMAASYFAHRGLWEVFRASRFGTEKLLVGFVDPMAAWAQAMNQAVVDAYVDQQGGSDARERELRTQLFDLIEDPARTHGVAEVLSELAYDPDGAFTVVVGRQHVWTQEALAALQRSSRRLNGVVQTCNRSGRAVMLAQGMSIDDLVLAARGIVGDAPLGVGLARRGLEGIRDSIVDGVRALRVAEAKGRPVVKFEEEWFLATLIDAHPSLDPLLAQAREVAQNHPELARAVIAFSEAGFSLAAAGEQLRLHPNSVSYRLAKWHERTGLEVRSFPDLARSLVAISRSGLGK